MQLIVTSVTNIKCKKNVANYTQTHLKAGIKTFYTLKKEVRSAKTAKLKSWRGPG